MPRRRRRPGLARGRPARHDPARGIRARTHQRDPHGIVFVPFHYGYWDADGERTPGGQRAHDHRWDPVSKQPMFKLAAVPPRVGDAGLRCTGHLANYIGLLHRSEQELRDAFREVGEAHREEVDVF